MYAKAEQLIRLVQNNPVLYDTTNANYCTNKVKDEKWDQIAEILNIESGKMARAQWTKLRDCHRDALRRQEKRRRASSKNAEIKPWIYQEQMEFLIPFMTSNGTTSDEQQIVMLIDDDDNDSQFTDLPVVVFDSTKPDNDQSEIDHFYITDPPTKKQKLQLKTDPFEESGNILQEVSVPEKEPEVVKPKDALRQFFDSMYNLTKAMPPKFQQKIQRQMFDAVTTAEEEIFMNKSADSSWPS